MCLASDEHFPAAARGKFPGGKLALGDAFGGILAIAIVTAGKTTQNAMHATAGFMVGKRY